MSNDDASGNHTRLKIGGGALIALIPGVLGALTAAGVPLTFEVLALLAICGTLIVITMLIAGAIRPMVRRKPAAPPPAVKPPEA